jgi:hypothetical protein
MTLTTLWGSGDLILAESEGQGNDLPTLGFRCGEIR